MHTTTTTTKTTTRARAGRAIGLVALLLALLGGGAVVTASPASANGSGSVTFCLQYSNGAAYANKPVYLYYAAPGGSWQQWKQGATNASGCGTWRYLPTGYHYATQGYWTYSYGYSGWYYNGWTGSAWLGAAGSTVIQSTGVVSGPYRLY